MYWKKLRQLPILLPAIDEEIDGEDGRHIGIKVSGWHERKCWVCGDRFLNMMEPELSGDCQIIFSSTESVAEYDELLAQLASVF